MKDPRILIVIVFVLAVAGILMFRGGSEDPKQPGNTANVTKSDATEITMLYSSEKKEWLEAAAAAFAKEHPEIKVTLKSKGSLAMGDLILDGKEKPTLVSPADSVVLSLLAYNWNLKNPSDIFAKSGDDQPQPLVITPLVFIVWQSRADILLKAGNGTITWKSIRDAVVSNQGWPAIGGDSKWGFVKLGHTDPTQSNSGLQALLLMSLEFYNKNSGLTVDDILKPDYQTWIQEIEKGVSKFESSTGTFVEQMIRMGPSKYDISVAYENLAISQLENAQGRWEPLKVYYPQTTLWSDHPVALVQADWVTPAQKDAARTWINYLRSKPIQESALRYGFRPGDVSIPIKSTDASNPFNRLQSFGIMVDIPPVATPPDGAVVENLLTMWSRVVKSR